MNKINKRFFIFTFSFFIIIILLYFIINAFSISNLKFKRFFILDEETNENNIEIYYTLNENDDVILATKHQNSIEINLLNKDDEKPKPAMTIFIDKDFLSLDDFKKIGTYYYLYSNNGQQIYQISLDDKNYHSYSKMIDYQFVINQFDDQIYLFNNESLLLNEINNLKSYQLKNIDENINNINFIDKNKLIVTTYQNNLYYYDLDNNNVFLINNLPYLNYVIDNNSLYYTYYIDNKLGICQFENGQLIKDFQIKRFEAISIKYYQNYLYLIAPKQILKVSIEREKKNETYEINEYQNMTFDLKNILIANEKLMFLPMIEYTNNIYYYHLMKYKI